ncbi:salicylate hydroxylase [Litoreibacter ascidiaceicola]|uniref:Salicylate hydroxylase n=1 Tax=Litoreibacter ascidiaceicola TaxID=1486859 RepID=A0A1M4SJB7_9RHOB|nr:FAD-dependent monooxygenase [Litoreibacter ascidiaceicola]SHE32248.1 salicylate hydroxylase [Litoreibacter ascidiaceicola]
MTKRRAVIAGGGIGGIACGLALARKGWEVEVLEQAPELKEVGAGIQVSPNGMAMLDRLGVTPMIEGTLFEPEAIELRLGRSGRRIFRLPMKGYAQARWGNRFIQIHRADLHDALAQALRAQPSAQLRTNAKITGYVRERGGASVYLERGDRVFGDVLIGADGVRSEIRQQICGADRARFTGNVAWRAVVPVDALGDNAPPPFGVIWAGRGKHAVTTRVKGGTHVNFVGIVEQDSWTEEGWSIPGRIEDALADFGEWQPCLRAVLEASSGLFRWALYGRPPLAKWCDGPVTLLGDAAHPMLPSMAQGAVMALEDAVVLAEVLDQDSDCVRALQTYEAQRKPRVTKIQQRSAANASMFHRHTGLAQLATYGPMAVASRLSVGAIHRQQDWIYSFDAGA